ncbi:MAG: hypothetical protein HFE57_01305 [Firmicutes bacterium]|nr:hypothetical protein [Bacillota bacterium]
MSKSYFSIDFYGILLYAIDITMKNVEKITQFFKKQYSNEIKYNEVIQIVSII